MHCLLSCGGCAIDESLASDEAFERSFSQPIPALCPQVLFDPEPLRAASVHSDRCSKCGAAVDEDGRCPVCSQNEWITDDIAAKNIAQVVDDTVSHGPEY